MVYCDHQVATFPLLWLCAYPSSVEVVMLWVCSYPSCEEVIVVEFDFVSLTLLCRGDCCFGFVPYLLCRSDCVGFVIALPRWRFPVWEVLCGHIVEILLCEGGDVEQWLEPRNIS